MLYSLSKSLHFKGIKNEESEVIKTPQISPPFPLENIQTRWFNLLSFPLLSSTLHPPKLAIRVLRPQTTCTTLMNPMKIRVSTHIFYHFQCGTQGFSVFSPLIITSSSEHRKYQFLIHFMLFFQHTTLMNPMKFISVLFSFWFFTNIHVNRSSMGFLLSLFHKFLLVFKAFITD